MKIFIFILLSTFIFLPAILIAQTQTYQGIAYTYDAAGNRIHRAPAGSSERKANPNPGTEEKKETVSVSESNLQAAFTPNPTTSGKFAVTVSMKDMAALDNEEKAEKTLISLYNPLGELILTKAAEYNNASQMDLSRYAKGVYFVKVQKGENEIMKKMVYE